MSAFEKWFENNSFIVGDYGHDPPHDNTIERVIDYESLMTYMEDKVLVPRDDWNYIIDCLEVETLDYPYKDKCKEIIKRLGGGET
jgi:hypothetical protein